MLCSLEKCELHCNFLIFVLKLFIYIFLHVKLLKRLRFVEQMYVFIHCFVSSNRFLQERVAAVGCELAAAHFMVSRGGKVRQKGSNDWIVKDEDDEYDLPRHFKPGFFVESIDASNTKLRYEGLECLGKIFNCVGIHTDIFHSNTHHIKK